MNTRTSALFSSNPLVDLAARRSLFHPKSLPRAFQLPSEDPQYSQLISKPQPFVKFIAALDLMTSERCYALNVI